MLNYKNVLAVSFFLIALALLLDIFYPISLYIYSGIVLAAAMLMIYGSASVTSGFYIKTYCSAQGSERSVALTFDDGPDEKITPSILKILKAKQVQAAFFCIGQKVEKNQNIVSQMVDDGHIIGGHSYTHSYFFDLYVSKKMQQEITDTRDCIFRVTGEKIKMFRPPYGVTNPNLAKAIKKTGCHVIGWSIRTKDTAENDAEKVFSTIQHKVKPGDVLLFHDTKKINLTLLPRTIDYLKENGYRIVRLDRLLNIDAYE
jgi:peptidoglycan-N-acetylglucosamine deacetylase